MLRTLIKIVLSLGLVALLLLYIVPNAIGTTVSDVGEKIGEISATEMIGLTVLWAFGLFIYTFVLTGSLQGLNHGQALTLNLTGSAVSNVLPFGGAVGMSLNYYMLRAWNMSLTEFSSYTVVTNVWNILMKLSMPVIAVVFALGTGVTVGHRLTTVVSIAAGVLAAVVALIIAALASQRVAHRLGRGIAASAAGVARLFKRSVNRDAIEEETVRTRDMVVAVVRVQWLRLSFFMTAYGVAQAALLYTCAQAVDLHVAPAAVLAAYAVERFLSVVPLTPAGLGFTEAGAAAILIAMGGDPTLSATAVILYRGFVVLLEVPVGGAWLGIWYYLHRRSTHREIHAHPSSD